MKDFANNPEFEKFVQEVSFCSECHDRSREGKPICEKHTEQLEKALGLHETN